MNNYETSDTYNPYFFGDYCVGENLPEQYVVDIQNEFEIFQEILHEFFLMGEVTIEHQPIVQKSIELGMKLYLNELVEARKMRE
jgi:hypothetical protein